MNKRENSNFTLLYQLMPCIYCSMDVASAPLSTSVPPIGQRISPYLSRSLASKEESSNFVCQKGAIHASLNSEMRFESEKSTENVRKRIYRKDEFNDFVKRRRSVVYADS